VIIERHDDERGFFARTFCAREFAQAGLPATYVQSSLSYNARRGTLRGMHFQWPPSREGKLVRCLRGAVHDVLLDLRPGSPSYMRHASLVLDDDRRDAVFIPHGVAHGFVTLSDHAEVLYQMTDFHQPDLASGVRWNDPSFGLEWPVDVPTVISARDAAYPDFDRGGFEAELARRAGRAA
jgi:dTDP-4-dehydrorhamnose 3,5-epimerase